MDKKTLFVVGTHGDESLGPELIKRLLDNPEVLTKFKSVIGNPSALAQNKRFIDADLNRVAPGDEKSSKYEVARASKLIKLFKQFDYVVDFHESKANDRIVIIIPRLCRQSLALALSFNIDEILVWPPSSSDAITGPLVQYTPFGIEIECGTKKSFKLGLDKLESIVIAFLEKGVRCVQKNFLLPQAGFEIKKFYLVYGRIDPSEVKGIDLRDFGHVDIEGEQFIPLLFGKHKGNIGYKMRSLDSEEILDIISHE